jgi:hypothetical protein
MSAGLPRRKVHALVFLILFGGGGFYAAVQLGGLWRADSAVKTPRRSHEDSPEPHDPTARASVAAAFLAAAKTGAADSGQTNIPRALESPRLTLDTIAFLEEHLASERKDLDWSQKTESAVVAAVSGLPGTHLNGLECRSSICRFNISHADATSRDLFLEEFPRRATGLNDGAILRRSASDDRLQMVAFFMRPGHQLPSLDSEDSKGGAGAFEVSSTRLGLPFADAGETRLP